MALNPLVSLFGRLVARRGRKRGNRQTDRRTDGKPSTITLAAHARRGLTSEPDGCKGNTDCSKPPGDENYSGINKAKLKDKSTNEADSGEGNDVALILAVVALVSFVLVSAVSLVTSSTSFGKNKVELVNV